MGKIFFTPEEDSIAKDLIELYYKIKSKIILIEQLSFEHKTNPQILIELRNAFDHLMRVFSSKYQLMDKKKNTPEYALKNMDKTYGHVYRAGYDALDLLNILLEEKIKATFVEYSPEVINTVYPEYYRKTRTEISKIDREIGKCRENKDVDGENAHTSKFENFNYYIKLIERLDEIREEVENHEAVLIEYNKKLKIEEQQKEEKLKKQKRWKWILYIGFPTLASILTAIIMKLID